MNGRKIRVLIVDHGSVSRNELVRQLENNPHIEVIGQAAHRRQAPRMVQQLSPDLLLLTLEMHAQENIETVENIMSTSAMPIMVMRFYPLDKWDAEYIARGALAVLRHEGYDAVSTQGLHRQVEMLVGVKVIRHIKPLRFSPEMPVVAVDEHAPTWPYVLAIACSTGGPQALSKLLHALPAHFPCPIIVAQHISDGFAKSLVQWLDSVTPLRVQLAQVDEKLEAGCVYILPPEQHLAIRKDHRFFGVPRQESDVYHPSCNLLLTSVADVYRAKAVGLIMTGMGSDGCLGIEAILRKGGKTLAQDEASSIVYGMNKNAVDKSLINHTLPLDKLASVLMTLAFIESAENESL
ncbi:chemotaxis protein CheB [Kluyvera sp. CHPC 1.251]|uniref:chemotaxis protein CheB n=1 Tax=Kluyvera sp. CHPC 1.251 TaxID=2995175 RepID=UPI002FD7A45E